uniref:Phosphatidylethanolamine-binding protein n=1 Tax=Glossina palpalis gambiensis TaxID=67801 RepID=A0A1B0BBX7_9MUSC
MTEPDAPSRENQSWGEWLDWLAVNIPSDHLQKEEDLYEYQGSSPAKGSGFHRYVFLLYRNVCNSLRHTHRAAASKDVHLFP